MKNIYIKYFGSNKYSFGEHKFFFFFFFFFLFFCFFKSYQPIKTFEW